MKRIVVVCVLVLGGVFAAPSVSAQRVVEGESPFVLAERSGEESAKERTFFLFSTSVAKYILRHDGMGEVTSPAGVRKVFWVKVGAGERIERVYSLEYEGDLLLLYQAGGSGYLARMNQRSRKVRSIEIDPNFAPPAIRDHRLVFNDGAVVALN